MQSTSAGLATGPEIITINSVLSEAMKLAEEASTESGNSAGGAPPARGHSPFRSQSFKRRQQRRAAAERQANEEQQNPNVTLT